MAFVIRRRTQPRAGHYDFSFRVTLAGARAYLVVEVLRRSFVVSEKES
jgi:hypothetical protein